jgi:hypothetical protein
MALSTTGPATATATATATAMAALARTSRNRMENDRDENKYAKHENKYSKRRGYQLDLQDDDAQRKYFAAMAVVILLILCLWLIGGDGEGSFSTPNRKQHHIIDVQSQLRRPMRQQAIDGQERTDDVPLRPVGDVRERLERLVHQDQDQIPEASVIRQNPEEEKIDAIQKLKQYQETLKEKEVILEEEDEIEVDMTNKDEIDHKLKIMELQDEFNTEE